MQKILFVCLGNICRSPLAEGIMLQLNKKHNSGLIIDSAGTSHYHVGEEPNKQTIDNAKKHGIDLSCLRARQFKVTDFDQFDKIYTMDKSNHRDVLALAKNDRQKNKVNLFLEAANSNSKNLEVPDPYNGTEKDFEDVFQLVYKACEELIKVF